MREVLIASFRSRTQVLAFHQRLLAENIACSVISTPPAIAQGCGLSVKIEPDQWARARNLLYEARFTAFAGAYLVNDDGSRVISRWG